MFESINDPVERGQVGIGTLTIFIAMVIIAAIAAGVLVNTAGILQTKSEATGQDSSGQVSNRVVVISAYGSVNTADDNVTNQTVEYVNLTVMRAAGADSINLSRSTVEWIGPDRATILTHGGTTATDADNGNFASVEIIGGENSVLNDQESRIAVVFNVPKIRNDQATLSSEVPGLGEGDEVQLKIITQYGATTTYYVNVPESLDGKNAVSV